MLNFEEFGYHSTIVGSCISIQIYIYIYKNLENKVSYFLKNWKLRLSPNNWSYVVVFSKPLTNGSVVTNVEGGG